MVSRVQQLKKLVGVKVGRAKPRVVSHKAAAAAIEDALALKGLRDQIDAELRKCESLILTFARRQGAGAGKKATLTVGGTQATVTLRDVSRPKGARR